MWGVDVGNIQLAWLAPEQLGWGDKWALQVCYAIASIEITSMNTVGKECKVAFAFIQ